MKQQVMVGWSLLLFAGMAQAGDVQEVVRKFNAIRPQETDLAVYRLDWAPTPTFA